MPIGPPETPAPFLQSCSYLLSPQTMLLYGLLYLRRLYLHLFLLSFGEIWRRIQSSNLLRSSCIADLSSIISTIFPSVEASVGLMNIQSPLLMLIVFWLCFLFTFGFMPSSCALWNLHFSWHQSSGQVHTLYAIWPFLSKYIVHNYKK